MRSTTIQFKVVIIFFLAIAGILGAGIIAWFSLQKMLKSVNTLAQPNHKLELLNNIQGQISLLNQANQHYYSFIDAKNNRIDYHKIVMDINLRVDSLRIMSAKGSQEIELLDSIQFLLKEIERGTGKLLEARQRNNKQNISSKLIKELSEQIKNYKGSDTSYIVKSTISEIRVSDFTLQKLDSLSRAGTFKSKPGIQKKISRLFSKKSKSQSIRDTLVIIPDKQIDTLTKVSIDSVKVISNDALMISLQESLQELYEIELEAIRGFVRLERTIQSKNINLLHTMEDMVNNIREEEKIGATYTILQAYRASGVFEKTLSVIIVLFTGAGLLLLYLLFRDIRRTGYYQQQLVLEKEKANKEAKMRQQFLAAMSHEIRTPLTSIVGYSDLLEDESEYNHAIKKSSEHLLHIANEILDLAKIEAGIIEIHKEPVAILQLLKDIQLGFQLKIKEKNLQGKFDLQIEEDLILSLDPYKLNQVLYNLLHNAVKFTDAGFIFFTASATSYNENQVELKIRIEDTGKGIYPEDKERIFEDYQQAGTHNDRLKGSGLGLGIVKKVVTLMGGEILLESTPGKGTAFTITLPLDKSNTYYTKQSSNPEPDLFRGKAILVVDDDPLIVRLHSIILTAYGANVITAINPLQALEYAKENYFDLAIIDIQMPDLNGIELLERLRALSIKPHKVIVSTANVLMSRYDEKTLDRFDAILYKPVHKTELINLVANTLEVKNQILSVDQTMLEFTNINDSKAYDLSDLRKFTMGDEVLLREILLEFYNANKVELKEAAVYLADHRFVEVAEKIHKLASRFGQIKVKQSLYTIKRNEENLRSGKNINAYEINLLIEEWERVNEQVKEKYLYN